MTTLTPDTRLTMYVQVDMPTYTWLLDKALQEKISVGQYIRGMVVRAARNDRKDAKNGRL
jgi:hypothetical protein